MHLLSSGKELGTTMVLSTKALTLDQGVQWPPQSIQRSHEWIYMKVQVQESLGSGTPLMNLGFELKIGPNLED